LANSAQSWHLQSQPIITRNALRAQRAQSRNRILLAEDNPVNQKVALRLLENLDYRVEVVADGLSAVAAWQTGRFDLIIMDCQMPQMDGYEATREIRRLEAGRCRTPIVALTAHAMKGDEQRCHAAGMDDYLSKPIDRVKLEVCLELLLHGIGTMDLPTQFAETRPMANATHPIDWQALLESIDGDTQFAGELADAFIGTSDRELAAIAGALDAGDAAALRESAHALKGASANMRAAAASTAAAQLESAAGSGQHAEFPALAEKLSTEVKRTIEYLRSNIR
jgi:CheY-like chemotaxis protein